MPRDSSRRPATADLRHRASSPVTALTAFSALVAVSVAVSAGIDPGAGHERATSAVGSPASSAERPERGWSLLAAGQEQVLPPAGPVRDGREASPVRDGGEGEGSWREGAGRGDGGRDTASTVRPGRQAPRLYQGELPVNTLIAPTRPGAVLPGGQFGWRIAPDRGGREFHNGTDVSAAAGLPVVAALDGVVTAVFWDVWGGNRVEVTHADGMKTTYNHLEDVRVQTGDRLAASEQLGSVGATGIRVTGPHLHFETWVDGKAVDPQSFDWVDGMRVIPASRSKYSLEVPVPETAEDPAAEKAEAVRNADAAKQRAAAAEKAEARKKADAAKRKAESQKQTDAAKQTPDAGKKADAEKKAGAEETGATRPPVQQVEAAPVVKDPEDVEPGQAAPAPMKTEPDPGQAPPKPGQAAPAPVKTEPKPGQTEPTPEQTAPEPGQAEPKPGQAEPKPEQTAPEPGRTEPEPGVAPVVVPDAVRDSDKDGTLDVEDPDTDGDTIPDERDDDIDQDGIGNALDPDMDGDGLRNELDDDIDGDGIPQGEDEEPLRPAPKAASTPATDPVEAATPDGPAGPAQGTGPTGPARSAEAAPAAP